MSRPPGARSKVTRVWVFCPVYNHMRVRSIAKGLLSYVTDATHWCPYSDQKPLPPDSG